MAASLLRVGIIKRPYSLIYRSRDLDFMSLSKWIIAPELPLPRAAVT
jgi:hypothetical protein